MPSYRRLGKKKEIDSLIAGQGEAMGLQLQQEIGAFHSEKQQKKVERKEKNQYAHFLTTNMPTMFLHHEQKKLGPKNQIEKEGENESIKRKSIAPRHLWRFEEGKRSNGARWVRNLHPGANSTSSMQAIVWNETPQEKKKVKTVTHSSFSGEQIISSLSCYSCALSVSSEEYEILHLDQEGQPPTNPGDSEDTSSLVQENCSSSLEIFGTDFYQFNKKETQKLLEIVSWFGENFNIVKDQFDDWGEAGGGDIVKDVEGQKHFPSSYDKGAPPPKKRRRFEKTQEEAAHKNETKMKESQKMIIKADDDETTSSKKKRKKKKNNFLFTSSSPSAIALQYRYIAVARAILKLRQENLQKELKEWIELEIHDDADGEGGHAVPPPQLESNTNGKRRHPSHEEEEEEIIKSLKRKKRDESIQLCSDLLHILSRHPLLSSPIFLHCSSLSTIAATRSMTTRVEKKTMEDITTSSAATAAEGEQEDDSRHLGKDSKIEQIFGVKEEEGQRRNSFSGDRNWNENDWNGENEGNENWFTDDFIEKEEARLLQCIFFDMPIQRRGQLQTLYQYAQRKLCLHQVEEKEMFLELKDEWTALKARMRHPLVLQPTTSFSALRSGGKSVTDQQHLLGRAERMEEKKKRKQGCPQAEEASPSSIERVITKELPLQVDQVVQDGYQGLTQGTYSLMSEGVFASIPMPSSTKHPNALMLNREVEQCLEERLDPWLVNSGPETQRRVHLVRQGLSQNIFLWRYFRKKQSQLKDVERLHSEVERELQQQEQQTTATVPL